jgi:hypothetical protein
MGKATLGLQWVSVLWLGQAGDGPHLSEGPAWRESPGWSHYAAGMAGTRKEEWVWGGGGYVGLAWGGPGRKGRG